MATDPITIEVCLPVERVVVALRAIHREFADKQQMFSLSMPFVQCSELQAQYVLASLPDIGIDGPTNDTLFEFYADWKRTSTLQRVWTVRLARKGQATTIHVALMNGHWPEIHELLGIFVSLLEEWALEQNPVRKHETSLSNQWLIEQYFDKGRTSYRELVDEWLERREREYKPVLANPTASIRTVINEEKKRRGIG